MEWFEPIIAILAISVVALPVILHYVKKKKGAPVCDCAKGDGVCSGDCSCCKPKKNELLTYYKDCCKSK